MNRDIRFDNLTLGYERRPAVHHLTTTIPSESLTAVVGPNGAGKSTLLRGICGVLGPLDGSIHCPHERNRIAYLPQRAHLDLEFPISVQDLVAMGLWHEIGAFGGLWRRHRRRVSDALDIVGLGGFGGRSIGTLSGGQLQRALFARLLLQDADLILLDEPFAAVDSATINDLMSVVTDWHGQGRTVLAVLHDLELVRRAFPSTLMLARDLLGHGPTEAVLTQSALEAARTMPEAPDPFAAVCARTAA